MIKLTDILNLILEEEKKKRDRCLKIADRKFDKPLKEQVMMEVLKILLMLLKRGIQDTVDF